MQQFGRKSSCLLVFRWNSALKTNQLGLGSEPTASREVQLPNHHHVVVVVFLKVQALFDLSRTFLPLNHMNLQTCGSTDFSWRINPSAHPTLCKVCQLSRIEACLIPSTSFIMSPPPNDTTCVNSKGSTGVCASVCVDACSQACSHHMQVTSGLATYEPPTHTHTPHMPTRHAWPSSTPSEDLLSLYDTRGVNCRPPVDWCEPTLRFFTSGIDSADVSSLCSKDDGHVTAAVFHFSKLPSCVADLCMEINRLVRLFISICHTEIL